MAKSLGLGAANDRLDEWRYDESLERVMNYEIELPRCDACGL